MTAKIKSKILKKNSAFHKKLNNKPHKSLLFSTQIHHEKLISSSANLKNLVADLELEAFKLQKMDSLGRLWSKSNYPHGYTSYSSHDRLHQMSSTFQDLEKKIDAHVKKYLDKLDYETSLKNLRMNNCWINIMSKNSIHTAHIHPQSVISGTFYVTVPKGASGLKFQDPRLPQFMNSPRVTESAKIHNQRFVTITPQSGDIVLFESWLAHEVPLSFSKEPRISISFNYDWK